MPEAVASNSIPVSNGQPLIGLSSILSDQFDDVDSMLKAFSTMNSLLLESGEDHSDQSYGVFLIHRLIMARLTEVADMAKAGVRVVKEAEKVAAEYNVGLGDDRGLWIELVDKVGDLVTNALIDAGIELDGDDVISWPKDLQKRHFDLTLCHYKKMMEKVNRSRDPLEVGSLLPWLELMIRREVLGDDATKQAAVDRIIERVTEVEGDARKAG
jgi:hypothetical protein